MNDFLKNMLSKQVYIVDSIGLYYFEDLRHELIKEIKGDILENSNDKDIVESGLNLLEKVYNANYGYNETFIIEELEKFGLNILKVNDVLDGLGDLIYYFNYVGSNDANNELIQNVKDTKEKIEKFFNEV